jgi:hypothetical protein
MVKKSLRKFWKLYRKTFDRFTATDSCTGNSTHITECAVVGNWSVSGGAQLVQGEYREGMAVTRDDDDDNNNNNNSVQVFV